MKKSVEKSTERVRKFRILREGRYWARVQETTDRLEEIAKYRSKERPRIAAEMILNSGITRH